MAPTAGRQRGQAPRATKHRSTGMNAALDHSTDLWPAEIRVKLQTAEPARVYHITISCHFWPQIKTEQNRAALQFKSIKCCLTLWNEPRPRYWGVKDPSVTFKVNREKGHALSCCPSSLLSHSSGVFLGRQHTPIGFTSFLVPALLK